MRLRVYWNMINLLSFLNVFLIFILFGVMLQGFFVRIFDLLGVGIEKIFNSFVVGFDFFSGGSMFDFVCGRQVFFFLRLWGYFVFVISYSVYFFATSYLLFQEYCGRRLGIYWVGQAGIIFDVDIGGGVEEKVRVRVVVLFRWLEIYSCLGLALQQQKFFFEFCEWGRDISYSRVILWFGNVLQNYRDQVKM